MVSGLEVKSGSFIFSKDGVWELAIPFWVIEDGGSMVSGWGCQQDAMDGREVSCQKITALPINNKVRKNKEGKRYR
jgi:hypothetical protein